MKKDRYYSRLIHKIIVGMLAFIQRQFVDKLPNKEVAGLIKLLLNAIAKTSDAASNDNPLNAEEIKVVWQNAFNQDLANYFDQYAREKANKIEDEKVRELALLSITPVTEAIRAVSDDVQPDARQLKLIALDFIGKEAIQDALLYNGIRPILDKRINSPEVVEFIVTTIDEAIEGTLEELPAKPGLQS